MEIYYIQLHWGLFVFFHSSLFGAFLNLNSNQRNGIWRDKNVEGRGLMHLSLVLGTCWALCGPCVGHVLEERRVWPPVSCKAVFSCHGPHSSYPVSSYVLTWQFPKLGFCSALLWWQTWDTKEPGVRPSITFPVMLRELFQGRRSWGARPSPLASAPQKARLLHISARPYLLSFHLLSIQPKERKIVEKHMPSLSVPVAETHSAYFI